MRFKKKKKQQQQKKKKQTLDSPTGNYSAIRFLM